MTRIALFHSVLGVRPGVTAAADAFRGAGHEVVIIDQYEGKVFADYEEASAFAESIGIGALMGSAIASVADEPGPFVAAGFSNGAGMAEYVTASRGGANGGVIGSLQFAGALPLEMADLTEWPAQTPVQLHYALRDTFRDDRWIDPFVAQVRQSQSPIETFLDYPISGHLFTDASLPAEYDAAAASLAFDRALEFLDRVGHRSG